MQIIITPHGKELEVNDHTIECMKRGALPDYKIKKKAAKKPAKKAD
jgi:hypothetical protein